MNKIKSKFKTGVLLDFLFVGSIGSLGSLAFLIRVLAFSKEKELTTTIIAISLFSFLFICSILLLNTFQYIKIDTTQKEIKSYSLLNPFGKQIRFADCIGYIKSTELTFDGEIETIHFVNKEKYTFFKLNTSLYKNAQEINNAIILKEIKDYKFDKWLYLKLLFTGKVKVKMKE